MLKWNQRRLYEEEGEAGGGGDGAADYAAQIKDLQARYEAQREETQELAALAEQYKAQLDARSGKAADPDDDDDLGVDPERDIEALNKDGLKAVERYMARRLPELARKAGLLDEQTANRRITSATRTQQLIAQYPDLAKPDSELHKAVLRHSRDLKGLDEAKLLDTSVKLAVAELGAQGKIRAPETEDDRVKRILEQNGVFTKPVRSASRGDELSPSEQHMIEALGITKEAYLAEARNADAAVSFSGRPEGGLSGEF
jgi:hypothetical protein